MKAKSTEKGNSRWYPCPHCENSHPSMTTLLDVIGSKALMGWAAKTGAVKLCAYEKVVSDQNKELAESLRSYFGADFFKSGKEMTSDAADYGTLTHSWIEAFFHDKAPTIESLPEPSQNAVKAFLTWKDEHKLKTIKTETTFYHCEANIAGTCDWIGEIDGELTLMDWKTSSGIFEKMPVQCWGYAYCDESQNGSRLYKQVGIGRFGKDGTWDFELFKRNEFPSYELCRSLISACSPWFDYIAKWQELHPYRPKKADKETKNANTKTP